MKMGHRRRYTLRRGRLFAGRALRNVATPPLQVPRRHRETAARKGQPRPVVEVIYSLQHEGRSVVTVRLHDSQADTGVELCAPETGACWRVLSLGFIPADSWVAGLRALLLEPLGHGQRLRQGERLMVRTSG